MGLQNLVGISLEQLTPVKETIKRLLDAAARHIADAKVQAISAETRFSSAYTAIRRAPTRWRWQATAWHTRDPSMHAKG
jgi:hypothetical protein